MTEITLTRLRDVRVSTPAHTLIRAGAEPSMVEDFRALADATAPSGAPRYGTQAVLEPLARFLVRGSAGANRDAALYELCHLVAAVDASGGAADRRNAFFLGPEAASAAQFRSRFERALAKGGWRRPGFAQVRDGIAVKCAGAVFTVHYSRMSFLAAVYEFLSGMEDFAFYGDFQTILDDMMAGGLSVKVFQNAANRIASRLRQYRRRHVASGRHDGKFDLILGFLKSRSPSGSLVVDDSSVLDFWCDNAEAGDFRTYRTVFDGFVGFVRALEEAQRAESISAALPIGTDRAQGECEPDHDADLYGAPGEWISPLAVLDEEPAAAIKFLKKEGERKPIELLMHYGPMAVRLPVAFLRLETFGPIQSAITTDLQVGRGPDSVEARVLCEDAAPYSETVATLARILDLVRRLQKAALYALHNKSQDGTADLSEDEHADPEAMTRLLAESARTFRAIARKGFDEAGLQDERRLEGFRVGAAALVATADQLIRFLEAVRPVGRREGGVDGQFVIDRATFGRKFKLLYGVLR